MDVDNLFFNFDSNEIEFDSDNFNSFEYFNDKEDEIVNDEPKELNFDN